MQFAFCNRFLSSMKTRRGSSQLAPTAQGWRTARQPLLHSCPGCTRMPILPKIYLFFCYGERGARSFFQRLNQMRIPLSSDTSWLSFKQS